MELYRLVLMTGKWYAVPIRWPNTAEALSREYENVSALLRQGTVVAYSDDIGTFADEMGIVTSDITLTFGE
jgi:hypothetical protein